MRLEFGNRYGSMVVGSKGAAMLALKLDSKTIISEFSSVVEADRWKTGYVLFPFPSRLYKGDSFQYETVEWRWPHNDLSSKSAIHGLSAYQEFSLETSDQGITCIWEYDGGLAYYPFPCRLIIQYRLNAAGLEQHISVMNLGSSVLPFHLGWHPYFTMNGAWFIDGVLQSEFQYDWDKKPVGVTDFTGIDTKDKVDKAVKTHDAIRSITIEDQEKRVTMKGMGSWYQIFHPLRSRFLAIEPLSGVGHPDTPWETLRPKEERSYQNILSVDLL